MSIPRDHLSFGDMELLRWARITLEVSIVVAVIGGVLGAVLGELSQRGWKFTFELVLLGIGLGGLSACSIVSSFYAGEESKKARSERELGVRPRDR